MRIFRLPERLPATGRPVTWKWIPKLERRIVKQLGIRGSVTIAFVSRQAIQKLNRRYRGQDRPTDVLSFNLADSYDNELGDIVICWPILKQQAKEHGNSLTAELQLLVTHGTLHLAGFDHDNPRQTRRLKQLEEKLLYNL